MGLNNANDSKRFLNGNLTIWDAEGPPPAASGTTVLWRTFTAGTSPECVSIPRLIEENADALRSRYLAWVYELGELRINGRRMVDHLQLRPGFSYWWMTLLVEKCNYSKSPQIDDAIRLLAFTDWSVGRAITHITLTSANAPLAECLRGWCEKIGVAFEWRRLPKPAVQVSWLRRAYAALPATIQAWLWLLKYLLERWPLRGAGLRAWQQTMGSVTFVSYLDNLVPAAVKAGRYESRYWGSLPELLQREGCKTNWLHLYVKDALLPDASKAAGIIQSFNNAGWGMETHATLDTFLTRRVVFQALKDWFRLTGMNQVLKGAMQPESREALNLRPLFIDDWQQSMCGQTAMANVLQHNLFETAMNSLTKQRVGVYLQENQGWEFGFIHAWKTASHGQLVGCPHSTVRFWDLRYFFDPRNYLRANKNPLPLPDRVAVNGKAATDAYLAGGYPADDLVEVEALRYLYLDTANVQAPQSAAITRQVLVLGDYLPSNTLLQMRLLEQAVSLLPQQLSITVKPHPNCPIQAEDYPALHMQISMEPIAILLARCDVAYTSAVTSAAVDAYCAGVPVVSVLDPNTLNLSPLRGCTGVRFASTPEALSNALIAALTSFQPSDHQPAYFTIDAQLPSWRRLLL